jgi:hypothetical protein
MQQKQSVIRLNKADAHAAVRSLVAAFNATVAGWERLGSANPSASQSTKTCPSS